MMLSRMDSASSRSSRSRRAAARRDPRQLEVGGDAGQQLAGAERLGEVVVGAPLEALDPRLLAGAGRDEQDRGSWRSPGRPAARGAGRSRRAGIITSESTRSGGCAGGGQGLHAVGDRLHVVPLGQQAADVLAHVGVVVGPEDRGRSPPGPAVPGRVVAREPGVVLRIRPWPPTASPGRAASGAPPRRRASPPPRSRPSEPRAADPVGRQVGASRSGSSPRKSSPRRRRSRPPPARRGA